MATPSIDDDLDGPSIDAGLGVENMASLVLILLLGNVVISKKIIRTRKIMVMHSNERGEYCLGTLIDCKRKHYDNTVDVVIRLHDRPILVLKVRTSVIYTRSAR